MPDDELRNKIINILGQHGSLSARGIGKILKDPKLIANVGRELKTMERRGLVEEPFIGSFTLTKKGKTEFAKIKPKRQPPPTWPPSGERGIMGMVNQHTLLPVRPGAPIPERGCPGCGEEVTDDDAWIEDDDGRWHEDCLDDYEAEQEEEEDDDDYDY